MIDAHGRNPLEVTDEIFQKLNEQVHRSIRLRNGSKSCAYESCAYGNAEVQHCAIGWLLPEDDDKLMHFTGSATDLLKDFDDLGENHEFIANNIDLLVRLQCLHDSAPFHREGSWQRLHALAPEIALLPSVLDWVGSQELQP